MQVPPANESNLCGKLGTFAKFIVSFLKLYLGTKPILLRDIVF